MKTAALTLMATIIFLIGSSAGAQDARTQDASYGEIVNTCLTSSDDLAECARIAARDTDSERLLINLDIGIGADNAESASGKVVQCKQGLSQCSKYNCYSDETLQQSVCDYIGQCFPWALNESIRC